MPRLIGVGSIVVAAVVGSTAAAAAAAAAAADRGPCAFAFGGMLGGGLGGEGCGGGFGKFSWLSFRVAGK